MNNILKNVKRWAPKRAARFGAKERISIIRRLSYLLGADIPIGASIAAIISDLKNRKKWEIFERAQSDIARGISCASVLRSSGVLSEAAYHLLKIGEETGRLPQVVSHVADELESQTALRRKLIGALVYPSAIVVGTLGIMILLIAVVFPKILPIFKSVNTSLPLSTRFLIAASDFIIHYYLAAGLVFVALGFSIFAARRKSERFNFAVDVAALKIPVLGRMIQHYHLASASRTLGILFENGMNFGEALKVMEGATANRAYRYFYRDAAVYVERGKMFSSCAANRTDLFQSLFIEVVRVGERTGTLPVALRYLSDVHEKEVDYLAKNLSELLEPVLMVGVGLVVGFVALSIITPIYEITQNIRR